MRIRCDCSRMNITRFSSIQIYLICTIFKASPAPRPRTYVQGALWLRNIIGISLVLALADLPAEHQAQTNDVAAAIVRRAHPFLASVLVRPFGWYAMTARPSGKSVSGQFLLEEGPRVVSWRFCLFVALRRCRKFTRRHLSCQPTTLAPHHCPVCSSWHCLVCNSAHCPVCTSAHCLAWRSVMAVAMAMATAMVVAAAMAMAMAAAMAMTSASNSASPNLGPVLNEFVPEV